VEERIKGETRVHSLALPRGAGPVGYGVVRQGDGRRHKTCALIVHQNPAQSLTGPQLPFVVYFCYESVSNTF
jgi:hypothetical protein